jgi:membrane associated rhomboid family serine protease
MSITLILVVVTVIISFIGFNRPDLMSKWIFNPYLIYHKKQYYRFFTHAFIHDRHNIFHLFFNMFVLYQFGENVELFFRADHPQMGWLFFLLLYFGGIFFSSLRDFEKYKNDPNYNALGASGAVSAVLFAHILIFPTTSLYLMFIPIPIPSFVFGALYLWLEHYLDKRGGGRVAHGAHIYGALFGIVFTLFTNFALLPRFFTQIADYLGSFFG